MSTVEEIKNRLDIVEYVRQYVPELQRAGRTYKARCPFHNEKTPSFVVNPDTQTWRCYGACAEGGDLFSFAQKINGWTFVEAINGLGELAGVEVRRQTPQQKERQERLQQLRGILGTASEWYHQYLLTDAPQAQQAYRYLRDKRGFTHETIVQFQLGYAPNEWQFMLGRLTALGYKPEDVLEVGLASQNDAGRTYDRFRNRVMIPIHDVRGKIVGFGARALSPDDLPKYLNSPQTPLFDKSKTLFGLDRAKRSLRDGDPAVIVEGYMDVIQAHQAGYTNVIAQMGTSLTEPQLKLIVPKYTQKLIMALDADDAGQNATRRSLEVARRALSNDYAGKLDVDMRILHMDGAKDPDDVLRETPDLWPQYIQQALPLADFVIGMEREALPPNASPQERRAVALRVLPLLVASENNLYRQENLQKLSLALHIPVEDLLAWAREQQAKPRPAAPQQAVATSTSGSDEPPPIFDDMDGVSSTTDPYIDVPAQPAYSSTSSRAAEGYCLKMLLRDPDLLFQINTLLRQLAEDNPALLDGPLAPLSVEDFSQSDYRILMQSFLDALGQSNLAPIEYLRRNLALPLLAELDALLVDEHDEINRALGYRFGPQMQAILKDFERRGRPYKSIELDVRRRVLEIRHRRLMRELQEMIFLLQEAQQAQNAHDEQHYYRQLTPCIQAKNLIQQALKQRLPHTIA